MADQIEEGWGDDIQEGWGEPQFPLPEDAKLIGELPFADDPARPDLLRMRKVYEVEGSRGPIRFTGEGEILTPTPAPVGLAPFKDVLEQAAAFASGGAMGIPPVISGLSAAEQALVRFRNPIEAYRKARDVTRGTLEEAEAKYPVTAVAGAVLPYLPVGGAATLPQRLGTAAGQSGLEGGLRSGGDITRGEIGQVIRDAAEVAAAGAAGGLLGEAALPLARAARRRGGEIVARKTADIAEEVKGEIASLKGKLGGETQAGTNLLKNALRAVLGIPTTGTSFIAPALQAEALAALTSPEGKRLLEKVLRHNLQDLPGREAVISGLEQELKQKIAGAPVETAQRAATYFGAPIWSTEIVPRLRRSALRATLTSGATGLGSLVGEGAGRTNAATGLGAFVNAPGTVQMIRNLAASPRIQEASNRAIASALEESATAAPHYARGIGARKDRNTFDAIIAALQGEL